MGFTKGPWQVMPVSEISTEDEESDDLVIVSACGAPIAHCLKTAGKQGGYIDLRANASVIASVPEMVSVLLKLHQLIPEMRCDSPETRARWKLFRAEALGVLVKALGCPEQISDQKNPQSSRVLPVDCRGVNSCD